MKKNVMILSLALLLSTYVGADDSKQDQQASVEVVEQDGDRAHTHVITFQVVDIFNDADTVPVAPQEHEQYETFVPVETLPEAEYVPVQPEQESESELSVDTHLINDDHQEPMVYKGK